MYVTTYKCFTSNIYTRVCINLVVPVRLLAVASKEGLS